MSFSAKQLQHLEARLKSKHVKERVSGDKTLYYIEGWHSVAEANRIFGFDNWDRETISSQCIWQKNREEHSWVCYLAKVDRC